MRKLLLATAAVLLATALMLRTDVSRSLFKLLDDRIPEGIAHDENLRGDRHLPSHGRARVRRVCRSGSRVWTGRNPRGERRCGSDQAPTDTAACAVHPLPAGKSNTRPGSGEPSWPSWRLPPWVFWSVSPFTGSQRQMAGAGSGPNRRTRPAARRDHGRLCRLLCSARLPNPYRPVCSLARDLLPEMRLHPARDQRAAICPECGEQI